MHTILHRSLTLAVAFVALASLFLGGCKHTPRMGTWDLVITPDASLNDGGKLPQVEVDLVGVQRTEIEKWKIKNVNEYFSGNDQDRANARAYSRTLTFSAADNAPKKITAKDDLWTTWKSNNAMYLVVLASSRTITPGSGLDSRRLIIPLDDRAFKKSTVSQIDIKIMSSGVQSPTPQEVIPAD